MGSCARWVVHPRKLGFSEMSPDSVKIKRDRRFWDAPGISRAPGTRLPLLSALIAPGDYDPDNRCRQ